MSSIRKYYMTEYRLNGSRYTNYLLANDREEAIQLAKVRGFGETVDTEIEIATRESCVFSVMAKPLVLFNRVRWETEYQWRDINQILHQCFFLLNLGACSGRYTPEVSLFGDKDPLHELLHCQIMDPASLYEAMFTVKDFLSIIGETAPELFYTETEIRLLKEQESKAAPTTVVG